MESVSHLRGEQQRLGPMGAGQLLAGCVCVLCARWIASSHDYQGSWWHRLVYTAAHVQLQQILSYSSTNLGVGWGMLHTAGRVYTSEG